MSGKSTIVVGALWGDEAKGKIANWIGYNDNYNICVRGGTGTNCGHSLYVNGEVIKTNQFPVAGILPTANGNLMTLGVGSGVMVDLVKAHQEAKKYNFYDRAFVDKNCSIITQEHKDREASGENYDESHTGSTKSGTGEARVDRVKRIGMLYKEYSAKMDVLEKPFLQVNCMKYLVDAYKNNKKILIEGAQSYFLSLYLSDEYPVVTSANCTATATADSVGLPWNMIDDVVLVVKSAPTRVSQKCGVLPGELPKEEVIARGIAEYGVTTGRFRRKSTIIPFDMLEEAIDANQPTVLALTFCDHIDQINSVKHSHTITKDYLREKMPKTFLNVEELERRFNVPVKYIEYGKEWNDICELI